MSVLICNGRSVAAADVYTADIVIDGERIHSIRRDFPAADLFVLSL